MHPGHRLSIAPMMAYTDRHYRYMMRLFTKRCLLYTEMVVGSTITHNLKGKKVLERALGYDPVERPLAVQLGGDDAETLSQAARVCEDYGYDEVNLNIGCPSDRVQKGRFGACLMKEPGHVADLVAAVRRSVTIPVNVKHRIGVDDQDSYEDMAAFVETVAAHDNNRLFIVHARKAWLQGLSPAQNRSVPPLQYDLVYRLKQDFPHLHIILNGGIQNLDEVRAHLDHVDGTMLGRAAYQQPELFADADAAIFGEAPRPAPSDAELIAAMDAYAHRRIEAGDRLSFIAKHLVGLFKNRPGARRWRQAVSDLVQSHDTRFDLNALYHDVFSHEAEADDTDTAA